MSEDTPFPPSREPSVTAGATPRIDRLSENPFLAGPVEFLVRAVADGLREVPQFALIFGKAIEPYLREDFSMRDFPALRLYNERFEKENESWYCSGDLIVDVLLPPSIRRGETQQLQDTLVGALVNQFRRPSFLEKVQKRVPGLDELGRRMSADKSLGFQWSDGIVPLTQIRVNFRLNLEVWDLYLQSECRTKDEPFERTLRELEKLVGVVDALRTEALESSELTLGLEVTPGDEAG